MTTKNIQYTLIFLLVLTTAFAQQKKVDKDVQDKKLWESLNKPKSTIIDEEDVFTDDEERMLQDIMAGYKKMRGIEFVIVSVADAEKFKSLNLKDVYLSENIESNGVMLAISKDKHRMRIQNGSNIKAKLSDAETRLIIDAFCVPKFQKDDYYQGALDGMIEIVNRSK
jgi:uncharacterized membrane protein YgcG